MKKFCGCNSEWYGLEYGQIEIGFRTQVGENEVCTRCDYSFWYDAYYENEQFNKKKRKMKMKFELKPNPDYPFIAKDNSSKWYSFHEEPQYDGHSWFGNYQDLSCIDPSCFPDCEPKNSLHKIVNGELVKWPQLKKGDKVIVTSEHYPAKFKRYFSHCGDNGSIWCFFGGQDSWSSDGGLDNWKIWRLPTEVEL